MNIQWYPGHMTKAKRAMKEDIKLIDLIIELVDARVPLSSRNPDIDELGTGKARIVLLNKSDLADERYNNAWTTYFEEQGFHVIKVNSKRGSGLKQINGVVQKACKEKIERDRRRGILNRPVRAMVVGIPNVGKSTFINSFAGKACAKTGNKPGVTKGNQWIRLNKSLELLDTPGILWPRFEDEKVGIRLALIGSVNDQILNKDELAMKLITFLKKEYPQVLSEKYEVNDGDEVETLKRIAKVRACLARGGELDLPKAANLFIDDFRNGKLGRITLEFPSKQSDL
jgi:ribosome biogenesis GTPase A